MQPFFNRNNDGRSPFLTVGLMGFFSGLPLALSGSSLQAWLTVAGVDLKTIGMLSLVGMPYLLKFLWAPALDRWQPLGLGRRRGWLVLTQSLITLTLVACALCDPAHKVGVLAVLALLLATLSATQDVASDAFRTEVLGAPARGLGTGYAVAGYRIAMFVSGAGALLLADRFGFEVAYLLMAAVMAVGVANSLFAPEPPSSGTPGAFWPELMHSLRAICTRAKVWPLLAIIVLYKLGDQFAGTLSLSFFIRAQGFSMTEIGAIYKGLGFAAALGGGLLGGALMYRLSLGRALLVFGALQALTNLGFLALALGEKSLPGMMLVVGLENLCGGMGTCAHVALMMALCDRRYTATQFALLTALASLGRVLLGPLAGDMVTWAGWPAFFAASCLMALPALILLLRLGATIDRGEGLQASADERP